MYVSTERKSGLYIDLLMTVRYSHEVWKGRVMENRHSRVCWRRRINPTVTYAKNDIVLMLKGEFNLAPNPKTDRLGSVWGGTVATRACVW